MFMKDYKLVYTFGCGVTISKEHRNNYCVVNFGVLTDRCYTLEDVKQAVKSKSCNTVNNNELKIVLNLLRLV